MGDYSDRKKSNVRTIDSSPLVQSNYQAKSTLESTLERIEARLDRLDALAVCRAHRGLPVGFLLLRYSV